MSTLIFYSFSYLSYDVNHYALSVLGYARVIVAVADSVLSTSIYSLHVLFYPLFLMLLSSPCLAESAFFSLSLFVSLLIAESATLCSHVTRTSHACLGDWQLSKAGQGLPCKVFVWSVAVRLAEDYKYTRFRLFRTVLFLQSGVSRFWEFSSVRRSL